MKAIHEIGRNIFYGATKVTTLIVGDTFGRYRRDFRAGYMDRLAGTYDKWYRYNSSDDGSAYADGQRMAGIENGTAVERFIEINFIQFIQFTFI